MMAKCRLIERRIVTVPGVREKAVDGTTQPLGTPAGPVELDGIDRQIMVQLVADGRMSVAQVAENVHISRAHAYSRINRLTREGVPTRFTALVDPIKAGLTSGAYVTL
jgi:hypothetical protein